jgi:hypothetical protein
VPTATNTPVATPEISDTEVLFFRNSGGDYSYNDGCTQRIDPVGLVIRRNGDDVAQHLSHHGDEPLNENVVSEWGNEGRQHFLDAPLPFPPIHSCVWGEVSQADKDGHDYCGLIPCAASRWHVRCNIMEGADPDGGTWAACTPHWDEKDGTEPCWHWVPAVFGDRWDGPGGLEANISGFTAGVDYVYYVLVAEGPHRFMGSYWYGNDELMHQCVPNDPERFPGDDGDWTGGDGWVNFIEVLP